MPSVHACTQVLHKQLTAAWTKGRIISSVCHGPVGLVNIVDAAGQPIVKGRRVTGFSNSEEIASGKDGVMPFSLEDRIKVRGGTVEYVCTAGGWRQSMTGGQDQGAWG